jgi:type VI secretion system secreted protein VgrG
MNTSINPPPLVGSQFASLGIELRCEDGPDGEWKVIRCIFEEGIDRCYRARVELSAPAFELADLLGADSELVFSRGGEELRRLYGVVARVEDLGEIEHRQVFAAELVPAFALLDMGRNSRIFQGLSVQGIVNEVLGAALGDYGREVDPSALSRGTEVRDYCVQYNESDFAFVCRLLEEEGIAFVFVHDPDQGVEILALRDENSQYLEFQNLEGEPELPLIPDRADQAGIESVQSLARISQLTPTAALRRDYDWRTPTDLLTEPLDGSDARERTRRIYQHTRRRYISDDLTSRASDCAAAERVDAELLTGHGNAATLASGLRFKLINAPLELEDEYLLLELRHEFQAEDDVLHYRNTLRCIPASVEYRPRQRTPKPRIHGPQTAIVVGDDEIHTDEHGRIQVQFHWEEQPSYATGASCWVRCAQSWAGPGWGAQFIPRVGMEVVVEFLEGNPDRPLVTGCVYNGENATPFVLPDDKTQSGWRTSSSTGGDGYNMLRFEDAAGNEEIHIHGQKDWTIVIENDKTQEIRHDESLDVTHDRTRHIGHDERGTIDHDRSIKVGHNHDESVGADQSITVGANRSETIGKNAIETVHANKTVMVDGGSSETVAGNKTVVAKKLDESVETDMAVAVGEKLRMTADKDFSLAAKQKGLVDAGDKLVLSCGKASITLKKNGDIQISGNKIEVKGRGDVKIKGQKVANN